MDNYKITDLMVPLDEYATVNENATLYEAVVILEKTQEEFDRSRYRHRAVLVLDENRNVIGKLSQLDVLRGLEPKYQEMLKPGGVQGSGFSKEFLQSMIRDYNLFENPLTDLCRKAGEQKVKQFMHNPTEGEYVDVNASLGEAIHQLVIGHHQSLLVTHDQHIVGILRLTDVFAAVFHVMKMSCTT